MGVAQKKMAMIPINHEGVGQRFNRALVVSTSQGLSQIQRKKLALAIVIGYLILKHESDINWSNKTGHVRSVLNQEVKFKHHCNLQNCKSLGAKPHMKSDAQKKPGMNRVHDVENL